MSDDVSVDELDARIEEQLSLLGSIDAQMVSRSGAVQSGDLSREDFAAWAVRALERRQHAASDLATLRHRRHASVQTESTLRVEVARLRELLNAANARFEAAELHHTEEVARLKRNVEAAYDCVKASDDRRAEVERDVLKRLDAFTPTEAQAERVRRLRESVWMAILDGEVATLHHEMRGSFLRMARAGVSPAWRDDRCAQQVARGYPRPRTSAECAAETASEKEPP